MSTFDEIYNGLTGWSYEMPNAQWSCCQAQARKTKQRTINYGKRYK